MQLFQKDMLQLLWLLPVLGIFFYVAEKKKDRIEQLFAERKLFDRLTNDVSTRKPALRKFFLLAALLLFIVALARPQWGEEMKTAKRKGVNVVFLVDTSLSMLVEDVKPNRIRVAQREIVNLIERLKGDRIGMVAFAGSGYIQVPLTLDHAAFRLFLDAASVGLIPDPGTSFSEAVRLAVQSFEVSGGEERVVVVFSDGENHEGDTEELLRHLKQANVRLYAVGIATPEGGPIPLKDDSGHVSGYKKDPQGAVVISKLDEGFLKRLAQETGGLYYRTTVSEKEIDLIYKNVDALQKKELSERQIVQREDRFQLFIAAGLILLAIEWMIGERKGILER